MECSGREYLFVRYEAYGAGVRIVTCPTCSVFIKPFFSGFLNPSFEILASQECRQGKKRKNG